MSWTRVFCFAATGLIAAAPFCKKQLQAQTARTTIVVVAGDASPDGNGNIVSFDQPAINNAGQVVFRALLNNTSDGTGDNTGIFRSDSGTLTQIARKGDTAPDGNGTLFEFDHAAVNGSGLVGFSADLIDTSGGTDDDSGVFLSDGATLTQVVRKGQPTLGGDETFSSFEFDPPVMNDNGQVAFRANLAGSTGGSSNAFGVFRGDGTMLVEIAREGAPPPDGNGEFSEIFVPSLNAAGQVAFYSVLAGTSGGESDKRGIFRGDGTSLEKIVRAGDADPDGSGQFIWFFSQAPPQNGSGHVSFLGALNVPDGDSGIFLGDGATITHVVRDGEPAPSGNGSFSWYPSGNKLNDLGQAVFVGELIGTTGMDSDDTAIFRSDGTTLTEIVREGAPAPDGNGSFSSLVGEAPVINSRGQVVFKANLQGTSGGNTDDRGLFFFDDTLGLRQVARDGDTFLGGTMLFSGFNSGANGRSGLNDQGQVAFEFNLSNGNGIAIWAIPEPTSLALSVLGVVTLMTRRRRGVHRR